MLLKNWFELSNAFPNWGEDAAEVNKVNKSPDCQRLLTAALGCFSCRVAAKAWEPTQQMPTGLKHALSEAPEQEVISFHSGDLPLGRKKKELPCEFLDTFAPPEVTSSLFYPSLSEPWEKHIKVICPAKSIWPWVKMPAEKRARKASDFS